MLLGNFNKDGNYSIDVEILKELVNVNKYITEVVDGTYNLVAKTESGSEFELNFILKIKQQEEGKKVAALTLVEKYVSPDNSVRNSLNTVVARYRDEDDIYFLSKVAKVFHIFDKRNEDGKEKENEEILKNILLLKKNMLLLKKKLAENNEYLSQYYIDNILAILKANPGKFSEFILRKYAMALENNKGNFGKANYYKLLRLELDKIINGAKGFCDNPEILKAIEAQKKLFIESYNKFEENIINPPAPAVVVKKQDAAKAKSTGGNTKKATAKKVGKKSVPKKAAAPKNKPQQFYPLKKETEPKYITITLHNKESAKTKDGAGKSSLSGQDLLAMFNEGSAEINDAHNMLKNFKEGSEELNNAHNITQEFNDASAELNSEHKTDVSPEHNSTIIAISRTTSKEGKNDSFEMG